MQLYVMAQPRGPPINQTFQIVVTSFLAFKLLSLPDLLPSDGYLKRVGLPVHNNVGPRVYWCVFIVQVQAVIELNV